MFDITKFSGEIPRIHPRLLPEGFAQVSSNAKLENGVLTPYRKPRVISDTVPANAKTIYKAPEGWLYWGQDVDVVQGPVDEDRIYYTGVNVTEPRLRVGGASYALGIDAPTTRCTSALKKNTEYLTIENKEIGLRQDRTTRTSSGSVATVSIADNTATVVITHETGLTPSQAQSVVNSLRYRNASTAAAMVPGLKIVRLTRIKDNGGRTYDEDQNPIGSDTRILEDIGSVVRVGDTTLEYTFPTPLAQSGTDEAGQNDPPTLTVDGLNPSFASGGSATLLFANCLISTVESGQAIREIRLTIEGLANAVVNHDLSETLVYSYTYLSKFDEETMPAPLSASLLWSPGQGIRLTGIVPSPDTTRVDRKRIYRSQTSASGSTDLYFVAEIANNVTVFDDSPDNLPPQEPVPSLDYDKPLDNMVGLVSMPNGMMAAFRGRTLCFSEPYRPHAWPEKYRLRTDFTIVGLATAGDTLVIMTTGCPYVAQGSHPANMRMERIEVNYPCVAKRSIVDLGYAVAYATNEGLVRIDQGGARLVSQSLFTPTQWRAMQPSTFVASQHQGRYILSHDDRGTPVRRKCTIIDLTGDQPFIIRTNWRPRGFFFDVGDGDLFYIDGTGAILQFDYLGGENEQMTWRSAPFSVPFFTNPGVILIESDKVGSRSRMTCKLYADGKLVSTTTRMNRVERLPSGYRAKVFEVEIVSNVQVYGIHLARTMSEIVARQSA